MIRCDGVRHRFDANETLFFQRELESIEATLFEFKKRELKYRMFIPVSNRDNPGAESITYRMFDKVGMAKVIANYSDDLPRADVFGKEFTQPVKSLGISVGWSTQEIRAAMMAGKPLESMKSDAARRGLRERESIIAWDGDKETGLLGLLDNVNIPIKAAPTGVGGIPWVDKTADEIIEDIRIMVSTIRINSKGIHQPDTLLLPIDQYDIIATLPRSSISDMTVLEFITKPGNSFGLTTIDWLSTELDNKFTGGTEDGAICYERTSEVLEQRIPMELQMLPVQEQGLEFVIPGESRHGGVVVRYPLAMLFFIGI